MSIPETILPPRLPLRPFCIEDAQAMYDHWASDPNVTRFLTWPPHESVDVTRQVLSEWIESRAPEWCIVPNEEASPMGSIAVVGQDGGTAEIGYCLCARAWGKGYAPEALTALISYLFAHGISRITAKHDLENPNSGKVMRKAGMTLLEVRHDGVNNLGVRSMAVYHIDKK